MLRPRSIGVLGLDNKHCPSSWSCRGCTWFCDRSSISYSYAQARDKKAKRYEEEYKSLPVLSSGGKV
jgi:hypothetical protein